MAERIILFEDSTVRNLFPLTLTRPVYDLRCGIRTLREKIIRSYRKATFGFHARDYLIPLLGESTRDPDAIIHLRKSEKGTLLLINGRLVAPDDCEILIPTEGKDMVYVVREEVAAMRLSGKSLQKVMPILTEGKFLDSFIDEALPHLPVSEVNATLIHYPWDLISMNSQQIRADFDLMEKGGHILGNVHPSAVLEKRESLFIGKDAEIQPGVILDASEGPIYIGDGATIMAGAALKGPVAIGNNSTVKMLAKIYEGTSTGKECKVGGEIEESLIHGFSNKQHDGFLGHSYLGEWVNVGAGSNTSDLKNNYSTVRVTINGEEVDTGSLFAGLFMGDHSKCGIQTMFTTGTVIGVGCNIFGADFPPKYIPTFSWGGSKGLVTHKFDQFLATAKRAMSRRNRPLSAEREKLFKTLFRLTENERKSIL
jgi:UDP-N-acetylglucosamine diphosphorylase/glucosamine-1-phosphate N-acetyltransferase